MEKVQPIFLQDRSNVFCLVVFALGHDPVQMEIKSTGIVAIHGPSCFAQTWMQIVAHRAQFDQTNHHCPAFQQRPMLICCVCNWMMSPGQTSNPEDGPWSHPWSHQCPSNLQISVQMAVFALADFPCFGLQGLDVPFAFWCLQRAQCQCWSDLCLAEVWVTHLCFSEVSATHSCLSEVWATHLCFQMFGQPICVCQRFRQTVCVCQWFGHIPNHWRADDVSGVSHPSFKAREIAHVILVFRSQFPDC